MPSMQNSSEPIDKILFIDKPKGITSFGVIRELRKKLGIKKMGHAGTLDPLATGLLIIACGKATKRISEFMGLPKEYEVEIEFGKVSNSYDADGSVAPYTAPHIPLCAHVPVCNSIFSCSDIPSDLFSELTSYPNTKFDQALENFKGDISQMPPIYSALKVNGKRAYDLARTGQEVRLEPRIVHVSSIEVIKYEWPFVSLRIGCSKGTYIRSIAHDLGQLLGCGGYVKELRRTKIGEYRIEDAEKIEVTPYVMRRDSK